MYQMMSNDRKIEEFPDIQSCVDQMLSNGWKYRSVMFCENSRIYQKRITIDNSGNVKIGRKTFVKELY